MRRIRVIAGLLLYALGTVAWAQAQTTPATPAGQVAGKSPLPPLEALPSDAYQVSTQVMPLDGNDILELRKRYEAVSAANQTSYHPLSKPVSRNPPVDLSPGAKPIPVRVERGRGVVVRFVDSAGRPWPVRAFKNHADGDGGFQVVWLDPKAGELSPLSIDTKVLKAGGAVSVMIDGVDQTIRLELMTDPTLRETDSVLTLTLPKRRVVPGSERSEPNPFGALTGFDPDVLAFLQGESPKDSKPLRIDGGPEFTTAILLQDGTILVRTTGTIVSPQHTGRASGNGFSVFHLQTTPTAVLLYGEDERVIRFAD